MDVSSFLGAKAQRTDEALDRCLASWAGAPALLVEAVRYSLFAGGKRFRPALVLGTAEIIGECDTPALPAACALEMIHTYSLIHDDLPAMDNDDFRRGRPTLHRAHGEAVAILAGDALLTMAFDALGEAGNATVIREVAQAAGAAGMVGGQLLDMAAEQTTPTLDELRRVHAGKTGALIRVSVRAGAMLAGAQSTQIDRLTVYGEQLGLAFQIADDILDVEGDAARLGKPVGSDAARGKATYPAIVGMAQSKTLAREAMQAAIDALDDFGCEADTFRALARFVVERDC